MYNSLLLLQEERPFSFYCLGAGEQMLISFIVSFADSLSPYLLQMVINFYSLPNSRGAGEPSCLQGIGHDATLCLPYVPAPLGTPELPGGASLPQGVQVYPKACSTPRRWLPRLVCKKLRSGCGAVSVTTKCTSTPWLILWIQWRTCLFCLSSRRRSSSIWATC